MADANPTGACVECVHCHRVTFSVDATNIFILFIIVDVVVDIVRGNRR